MSVAVAVAAASSLFANQSECFERAGTQSDGLHGPLSWGAAGHGVRGAGRLLAARWPAATSGPLPDVPCASIPPVCPERSAGALFVLGLRLIASTKHLCLLGL